MKVAPQTFSLRDVQLVAVCDVKALDSKGKIGSTGSKVTYSFLDAAEKVLGQFGNRNSMHYRNITDKALEQGSLNTGGKTPEATMNAQLVTELKRTKASGEPRRLIRTTPEYYNLVKWVGIGLQHQISKHNREVRRKLLSQLIDLTLAQFEALVGQWLPATGFESVDVTEYNRDGGIDVRGMLLISDVVCIKMAIQAKHRKVNIPRPTQVV